MEQDQWMKYTVRLDNSMITEILFTDALTSVSAVVIWDSISNWHLNKVLTDKCGWTYLIGSHSPDLSKQDKSNMVNALLP